MFQNCTPHSIKLVDGPTFEPSGTVARVSQKREVAMTVGDIQFFSCTFGETVDLPSQQPETLLIVSALVRSANASRLDLISPGELVRDDKGQVIGCKGFDTNF